MTEPLPAASPAAADPHSVAPPDSGAAEPHPVAPPTMPLPTADPADPEPHGPLGELALSFSGGGYRAAAFHLGALRMLHRAGLLRDVVALSTVSGGSIVGAAWVLGVMRGEGFDAWDGKFAKFLRETNVIRDALDNLTSHREHGHPSHPSLIRSAARVYARPELFGDTRMAEIRVPNEPASADAPRFREIIFNSTEFRTGVDFRFRRSANPQARMGNRLRVPKPVAERVRVADAVAASSCFPGGFEPYLFPQQFHWPADMPCAMVEKELGPAFAGGVPLMDGGIWDNQGVDSLVLAFRRGRAATLVVSDVAARSDDIYNFPPGHKRGWVTLRVVSILGWVLLAASLVSALLLGYAGVDAWRVEAHDHWFFFRYVLPFLFCAAAVGVLAWLRVLLAEVQARIRTQVEVANVWHDVAKLTVREALMMIELRVGSVMALTSSIFMKRIRTLIFGGVSGDPAYQGRLMANFIYAMDRDQPKLFAKHPWLAPSPTLRKLAKDAEAFPTTLWFTGPGQMEMVARAGEVTLCFVLLQFMLDNREAELADPESPASRLFAFLRSEWAGFNA